MIMARCWRGGGWGEDEVGGGEERVSAAAAGSVVVVSGMILNVVLEARDIDASDSDARDTSGFIIVVTAAGDRGGAATAAVGDGGVGKARLDQKGSESLLPLTDKEEEEEEEEEQEVMEVDGDKGDDCDCIGFRLLRPTDAALWSLACWVAKTGARHCWRREAETCFFVAVATAAPFLPTNTR